MNTKEPFNISVEHLNEYLELSTDQFTEVAIINNFFLEAQKQCLKLNPELQKKQIMQTVYDNLTSMKKILTPKQYQKYLILLNVMNNNRQKAAKSLKSRMYLTKNNIL